MKHQNVFSFCNQKGGVGKTTTAINLSTGLAQLGYKVLLIDIDPQGNATSGLGVEKTGRPTTIYQILTEDLPLKEALTDTTIQGLTLAPSAADLSGAEIDIISLQEREFRLRKSIDSIRGEFDLIFIDCPPSLGLLTVNALTASDYILIPLQCEYYALEGLGQLLGTYTLVQKNLNPSLEIGGVLLTMADFRTRLTEQVIQEVKNYFKDKVFEIIIPRSVRLSEAPSFGQPGIIYDRSSRGSRSYIDATTEFIKRFKTCERKTAETIEKGVVAG